MVNASAYALSVANSDANRDGQQSRAVSTVGSLARERTAVGRTKGAGDGSLEDLSRSNPKMQAKVNRADSAPGKGALSNEKTSTTCTIN